MTEKDISVHGEILIVVSIIYATKYNNINNLQGNNVNYLVDCGVL